MGLQHSLGDVLVIPKGGGAGLVERGRVPRKVEQLSMVHGRFLPFSAPVRSLCPPYLPGEGGAPVGQDPALSAQPARGAVGSAGGVGRTGSLRPPLLLSAGRPGASHSANFSTPAGGERRGWVRPEEGGWVGRRQGASPARKSREARACRAKRPRLFSRRSLSSLYYSISPALSSVWEECSWAYAHPSRAQGPFYRHGRAEWLWRTGENSGWAWR